MSERPRPVETVLAVMAAPRVRQALTIAILGFTLAADVLRVAWGRPGEIAVHTALVLLAALSWAGLRGEVAWRGILPVSLLALLGWVLLSVVWTEYRQVTIPAVLGFAATVFLGMYVAVARDLIQLVRAFGDVLRAVLVVSLGLELLSGIVLDTPLPFLGIAGNLAEGGPIQGILGTRNHLGFIAGVGIVTFLVEWRTRSVRRPTSLVSLVTAAVLVVFSGSPVTVVVLAGVGAAGLVLWGLRRAGERLRRMLQPFILVAAGVVAIVVWSVRDRVLALLDATGDFGARVELWRQLLDLVRQFPVEGWGWAGAWPRIFPFTTTAPPGERMPSSALNAYLDVMLQLGLVGLGLFVLALGLATWRAWLVAGEARSTVNTWPALVLLLIVATGLAESYPLTGGGLVLFTAACIAAARKRSWRGRLPDTPSP